MWTPAHAVRNVRYQDTHSSAGIIEGTIYWEQPVDTELAGQSIDGYTVYIANDESGSHGAQLWDASLQDTVVPFGTNHLTIWRPGSQLNRLYNMEYPASWLLVHCRHPTAGQQPASTAATLPMYDLSSNVPSASIISTLDFVDEDATEGKVGGAVQWSVDAHADLGYTTHWVVYLAADASGGSQVQLEEVPRGTNEMSLAHGTNLAGQRYILVYPKNPNGPAVDAIAVEIQDVGPSTTMSSSTSTTATATVGDQAAAAAPSAGGPSPSRITGLTFTDADPQGLEIGGSIVTWTPPLDVSEVERYLVYISHDAVGTAKAQLWDEELTNGALRNHVPVGTNQLRVASGTDRRTLNSDLPANWLLAFTWSVSGQMQPVDDAAKLVLYDQANSLPEKVNLVIEDSALVLTEVDGLSGLVTWSPGLQADIGYTAQWSLYLAQDPTGANEVFLGTVPVDPMEFEVPLGQGWDCGTGIYLGVYARNEHGRASSAEWVMLNVCTTTTSSSSSSTTRTTSTTTSTSDTWSSSTSTTRTWTRGTSTTSTHTTATTQTLTTTSTSLTTTSTTTITLSTSTATTVTTSRTSTETVTVTLTTTTATTSSRTTTSATTVTLTTPVVSSTVTTPTSTATSTSSSSTATSSSSSSSTPTTTSAATSTTPTTSTSSATSTSRSSSAFASAESPLTFTVTVDATTTTTTTPTSTASSMTETSTATTETGTRTTATSVSSTSASRPATATTSTGTTATSVSSSTTSSRTTTTTSTAPATGTTGTETTATRTATTTTGGALPFTMSTTTTDTTTRTTTISNTASAQNVTSSQAAATARTTTTTATAAMTTTTPTQSSAVTNTVTATAEVSTTTTSSPEAITRTSTATSSSFWAAAGGDLCQPFASGCEAHFADGEDCEPVCTGSGVSLNNLTCFHDLDGAGHLPGPPLECLPVQERGNLGQELHLWGLLRMWIETFGGTVTQGDFRQALVAALLVAGAAIWFTRATELRRWNQTRELSEEDSSAHPVLLNGTYEDLRLYQLEYMLRAPPAGIGAEQLLLRAKAIPLDGTREQELFVEALLHGSRRQVQVITFKDLHAPVLLPYWVLVSNDGHAVATSPPMPSSGNGALEATAALAALAALLLCACCGVFARRKWQKLRRREPSSNKNEKGFTTIRPTNGEDEGHDEQDVLDVPESRGLYTGSGKHVRSKTGGDDLGAGVDPGRVELLNRSPRPMARISGQPASGQLGGDEGTRGKVMDANSFWNSDEDPIQLIEPTVWSSPKPDMIMVVEVPRDDLAQSVLFNSPSSPETSAELGKARSDGHVSALATGTPELPSSASDLTAVSRDSRVCMKCPDKPVEDPPTIRYNLNTFIDETLPSLGSPSKQGSGSPTARTGAAEARSAACFSL